MTLGLFAFESWHDPVSERRREPGKIQAEVAQARETLGITGWLAREHCLGSAAAATGRHRSLSDCELDDMAPTFANGS